MLIKALGHSFLAKGCYKRYSKFMLGKQLNILNYCSLPYFWCANILANLSSNNADGNHYESNSTKYFNCVQ